MRVMSSGLRMVHNHEANSTMEIYANSRVECMINQLFWAVILTRIENFVCKLTVSKITMSLGSRKCENQLQAYFKLPGGHGVHPSAPRDDELENVPTGHGRKL